MIERRVDQNAIRTSQALVIGLLALAFVVDVPVLVGVVSVSLLIAALYPPLAPFARLYRHGLRLARIVRPDVIPDNPEPHRFAQLLGGTMTMLGLLALVAGADAIGWALAGVVIVLAGLNLFAGWCAGCTVYYWLNRLGVPGFDRARLEGGR
jgi:hypothetical protein